MSFASFEQYFPICEVTPRKPEMHNILIFASFEQCFLIFEVTPRTAGSAEYIDVHLLRAMFSYVRGHSEDVPEERICYLFACFEQCFPMFEVTPRTPQSREYVVFYML